MKVPDRTKASWSAANLAEPSCSRLRHEMFAEQFLVLDHRALERLENHAALRNVSGSGSRSSKLIVGENQPPGDLHRARRSFEDFSLFVIGQR